MGDFRWDIGEFESALDALSTRLDGAVKSAVADGANLIESTAKNNAPVRTGSLRRSISMGGPVPIGLGVYRSTGGPTIIYSRRIELGFQGPDRIGRVYHEAGHPYFTPAVASSAEPFQSIFASRVTAAFGG